MNVLLVEPSRVRETKKMRVYLNLNSLKKILEENPKFLGTLLIKTGQKPLGKQTLLSPAFEYDPGQL